MTTYFLPLAVLAELAALLTGVDLLSTLSGTMMLTFFLLHVGRLEGYARYLFLVTVTVVGGLGAAGQLTAITLHDAVTAAAFYAAFLGSLGMMQCLVRRFEVLRRIHDVLLGGPSVWLYPKYALTSCLIASVLNFGVMNLLCGALTETLDDRRVTGQSRLRWLRSVLSSTLRGFALVPLIAPTSVAVAIITREVPSLTWGQILPFSLMAAAALIAIGWGLEYRRFHLVSQERQELDGWPPGSGRLVLVVLAVFAVMGALVALTDLNVSRAAMLTVPTVTFIYMVWEGGRVAGVIREMAGNVSSLTNEMCIFASSAALGVTLAAQVPPSAITGLLEHYSGIYLLAVAAMLILPLGAAFGIAPITVLSFIAGLLGPVAAQGYEPLLIAVALVIGFSMAMILSPFGPSVMLLSRFGRLSRWVVAFGWNGTFALLALPVMLLLLWLWVPFTAS